MKRMLVVCALLAACNDQGFQSLVEPPRDPNPRDLERDVQVDRFVQSEVPEVDVLWVVDNSGSMQAEQAGISENAPVFMDFFVGSGLDYHIGVVSTDMDDPSHQGKLRQVAGVRWIDPETPDPSGVFAAMIQMGTGGSSWEKGTDAAYHALEVHADGFNDGFERDDATLHTIVLSDEADFSQADPQEFRDWYLSKKPDPDALTFSSIVSPAPVCGTASMPGDTYLWMTAQIGGISWNICDTEWAQVLEQLGIQASALKREYFLSRLPVPDTIEITVAFEGVTRTFEPETEWTYDASRNSVILTEFVPEPLADVTITYKVLGTGEGTDMVEPDAPL